MTFLHPALLAAGLACIAIPIIIHLLMHRRRKPVMWGAMRFLLEAYRRQRRRLMLEKWLLLACRCLILLLIAVAIGRPLLGRLTPGKPGKAVYILIDNGLASGARDDAPAGGAAVGSSALARHKTAAKSVLKSLRSLVGAGGGEADRVGIITLGGPSDGLVLPASANLGSVDTLIDSIEATDSRTDLAGGLSLLSGELSPTNPKQAAPRPDRTFVIVLSDYLEGSIDLSSAGAAGGSGNSDGAQSLGAIKLPPGVRLISSMPSESAPRNISITAVEPLRSVLVDASGTPGSSADLTELVRIAVRRTGDLSEGATTTVRAHIAPIDGAERPAANAESASERAVVRWAPGQESAIAIVPVRADRKAAAKPGGGAPSAAVIVASIDDDALPADNRWRRPVELRDALRVAVVAPVRFGKSERLDKLDPASWARLALAPAGESARSGVDVIDVEPAALDAARLGSLDAVVLPRPDLIPEPTWPRLRSFIDSGGLVFIMPPPGVTVHLWGDPMARAMGLDWALARESVAGSNKLRRGGPAASADASLSTGTSMLSLVDGELDDLLSPVNVQRTLRMQPQPESGEALLRLDDNAVIMWAGVPGGGQSTVSAAPNAKAATQSSQSGRGLLVYLGVALDLEWSDLPAKPLMVPLVQEVLRQGIGRARGSWSALAGTRPLLPPRTAELGELPDPARVAADREHALGRARVEGGFAEPLRRAGLWRALDERSQVRGLVAVNPDPRAGRTQFQTQAAVAGALAKLTGAEGPGGKDAAGSDAVAWLPPTRVIPGSASAPGISVADAVATVFGRADAGSPISWPLLLAALAFSLLEILLARRASHADTLAPATGTGLQSLIPVKEAA